MSEAKGIWALEIQKVGHSDEGIYECQTNTEVKASVAIRLDVMGKYARIFIILRLDRKNNINHSTSRFIISLLHFFVETRAVIDGEVDHYVKVGSTLHLTCRVYLGTAGPDDFYAKTAVIHWFHDQRLLDPDLENWKNTRTISKSSNSKSGFGSNIVATSNSSLGVNKL